MVDFTQQQAERESEQGGGGGRNDRWTVSFMTPGEGKEVIFIEVPFNC